MVWDWSDFDKGVIFPCLLGVVGFGGSPGGADLEVFVEADDDMGDYAVGADIEGEDALIGLFCFAVFEVFAESLSGVVITLFDEAGGLEAFDDVSGAVEAGGVVAAPDVGYTEV